MSGTALRASPWREGLRDGVPIGMGYFAVAFSLGIAARRAGITALQGFFISLLNHASAGEYAGITLIAASAPYWEMALTIFVANARYLLMSCALSQRLDSSLSMGQRLLVGFGITDEIFAVAVARSGKTEPTYIYGTMVVAIPCWALGTALGITAGNFLPARVVSGLSVALYGMFLAILIPAGKGEKTVGGLILLSFAASGAAELLPLLSNLSAGVRVVLLTVVLAGGAAVLCPVEEEKGDG